MSASTVTKVAEVRSLTGLRGCAAVLVMLYHFALSVPPDTLPMHTLLHNGYLCVDLFFVLSGFVMAYSQRGIFAGGYRLRAHGAYLVARLARIYPLYALITLESFCLLVWRTPDANILPSLETLALNLGLVQAWGLAPSLEGATWSISTEWGAYLLFPLLLALTVRGGRWMAAATAALTILMLVAIANWPFPVGFLGQGRSGPLDVYSPATSLPLLRCVAEFTLGLLTFRAADALAAGMRAVAGPLAAIAVTALAVAMSFEGLDVCVVALFALLIFALVPQVGRVSDVLSRPAPYRLGQWSYSIYLLHDKFSHSVTLLRAWLASRVPLSSLITVVIVAGTVVLASAITYVAVELPLRRLTLRAMGRRRPVAIETAPVALAQP